MNADKIKQIALEKYGKELSDKQAAGYTEKYGKLSDDELGNVSGGYNCTEDEFWHGKYCEPCGVWCDFFDGLTKESGGHWKLKCPVCGTIYE